MGGIDKNLERRGPHFARAGRVWRCLDCQNLAGATTVFDISNERSVNALGTDWQKFLTYAEAMEHYRAIHAVARGQIGAGQRDAFNCWNGGWG